MSSSNPEIDPTGIITLGANSGAKLLNSGSLVIAALLFFISFLLLIVYILYKDTKETNKFLNDVQLRSLEAISALTTAINTNNDLMRQLMK